MNTTEKKSGSNQSNQQMTKGTQRKQAEQKSGANANKKSASGKNSTKSR